MIVLDKPVITEKSMAATAGGKYVFRVCDSANKHEIARDVENIYKVKVTSVNILKVQGHKRMIRGRARISVKPWKKAIVTLKKGQKIDGFEIKEQNKD